MRWSFLLGTLFFLLGCGKTINEEHLTYLNGYWEIKQATMPDGSKKDYSLNPTVDFIKMDGTQGFRKKMKPNFDGTFDTSDDAAFFSLLKEGEQFIFHYKNDLSEWEEALLELSQNSFSVSNEQGITYNYERFKPINGKE